MEIIITVVLTVLIGLNVLLLGVAHLKFKKAILACHRKEKACGEHLKGTKKQLKSVDDLFQDVAILKNTVNYNKFKRK